MPSRVDIGGAVGDKWVESSRDTVWTRREVSATLMKV